MEKLKAAFKQKAASAPSGGAKDSVVSAPVASAKSSDDAAPCSWPQQAKLLFKRSWCAHASGLH